MNSDKEIKQRLKRKLLNACNELDGLAAFVQVHNKDDESAAARRGNEMLNELESMAESMGRLFANLNS